MCRDPGCDSLDAGPVPTSPVCQPVSSAPPGRDGPLLLPLSPLPPVTVHRFQAERHAVHTDVFDGPLELLLYLIRRDGIDVRDIPIAHVTVEYLSFLDQMEELDLDVAGDFFVMAATLCELKSRELFSKDVLVDDEDAEDADPRDQLVRRLLEYERYRRAAADLGERPQLDRDVFARPDVALSADECPVDPGVDAFGLLQAFYDVLKAAAEPEPVHEVEREQFSFDERVEWVMDQVALHREVDLGDLLSLVASRAQRVLTFLALLELARRRVVAVVQEGHLAPVTLHTLDEAALGGVGA